MRAARLRPLAANAAVGVLAGVLVTHVRLHLGLPGHKALLWMIPVLLGRLAYRHPAGATAGASAAACAALALGGNLAGGVLFVPLVALAGGLLDGIIALAERCRLSAWSLIPLLAAGGAAGNLLCAVKRLLTPLRNVPFLMGLSGLPAHLLSYALFGLLAGLTAATLAAVGRTVAARRRAASQRVE